MIKTLQKKFIITSMIAITIMILIMLGAINIVNVVIIRNNINETLGMITENEGNPNNIPNRPKAIPPSMSPMKPKDDHDKLLSSNFFVVRFDNKGSIIFTDTTHIATVSDTDVKEIAESIYSKDLQSGKIGKFKFLIVDSKGGFGKTAVFLDTSAEIISYIRVLMLSVGAGIICWGFMLLLVILLSRMAIRPIAENMEKQKQFITNAGHEIKTPLAIIQANTDALELYNGETKWSNNIKEQVLRLNGLMKNMLMLAKMDEGKIKTSISNFCISELFDEYIQFYSEPFSFKKIQLKSNIQDSINISADKDQISQLISILMDNALKYTNENGMIIVDLQKTGKKIHIQIKNTCEKLPDVPPEKLFDRFFRADKARTQKTGGYGIGLSIAQSFVQNNHGKLVSEYKQPNFIIFTITF